MRHPTAVSSETTAQRLAAAGWPLPDQPRPRGHYRLATVASGLVITAGQLPRVDGALAFRGRIGVDVPVADAGTAAEIATLNALAILASTSEDGLEDVDSIVQLRGYLRASDDFEEHASVMDAASAVLNVAFPGGHARTAIGVTSLPGGSPVEVEIVAKLVDRR